MATEAARFPGRPLKEDHSTTKGNYKTDLTLTGLLMEGLGSIHQSRRLGLLLAIARTVGGHD
jgi:hypothetical protein